MSTRITVRLDDDLHTELLRFAHSRRQGREREFATIMREALAHYLATQMAAKRQPHGSQHKRSATR